MIEDRGRQGSDAGQQVALDPGQAVGAGLDEDLGETFSESCVAAVFFGDIGVGSEPRAGRPRRRGRPETSHSTLPTYSACEFYCFDILTHARNGRSIGRYLSTDK